MRWSASQQVRIALFLLAVLVVAGTVGYSVLWNVSLLDGLYMTVITLTTVGYRELQPPSAEVKAFTIALIVLGVGTVTWAVRAAAEIAVGEQVRAFFGKRQLEQTLSKLKGHTVICGFGRMGGQIAADLARAGKDFVVIDPNPLMLDRLKASGYPYLAEDASSEEVLRHAGVTRAANLVSVAASDAENIFIVLTARDIAPGLNIVARSTRVENEGKLHRAGADRVVSPYVLGGKRMSAFLLHPHSVDFLEVVMGSDYSEMELAGVEVGSESTLAGRRLGEAELEAAYGVTVIAMKRDGIYGMAPDRETTLHPGDVLMVIGPSDVVEALKNL